MPTRPQSRETLRSIKLRIMKKNISKPSGNLSEEEKISSLKKAIQEGLESGRATDFDPKKHLAFLKAHKAAKK